MGETRVDLQHLLEDLRDAYTGSLEETILTEVVANALDSGASTIGLTTDAAEATLTIVDNGRGMQRRELARYHDVAASTKSRGEGIGFAGVGIKLGLLVSREVVTETRRRATHVATRWHLASRHRAPWKWIPPPGLTAERGTAVRLTLHSPLSPLLDAGYLEETVRRHFEPLLDPTFDELLRRHYPTGVRFEVDGRPLTSRAAGSRDLAPVAIRLGRRRLPSAIGFIERHHGTLPEDRQGIAISTFGKVIKRGWDWLGLAPAAATQISGLIDAPDLAASLTLSKSDFIRTGPRGAAYLAYRKAIQEVLSRQLAAWGDRRDADARPRTAKLERDLERVLEDLADDFSPAAFARRPAGRGAEAIADAGPRWRESPRTAVCERIDGSRISGGDARRGVARGGRPRQRGEPATGRARATDPDAAVPGAASPDPPSFSRPPDLLLQASAHSPQSSIAGVPAYRSRRSPWRSTSSGGSRCSQPDGHVPTMMRPSSLVGNRQRHAGGFLVRGARARCPRATSARVSSMPPQRILNRE